jgi:predicted ATPase
LELSSLFISYNRQDREIARRIKNALENQLQCETWWDEDIHAASQWNQAIDDALKNARCVVVLWSTNSVTSDWVLQEAAVGRTLGKLMPVQIDSCNIPSSFTHLQTPKLHNWQGDVLDAEFKKLTNGVKVFLQNNGLVFGNQIKKYGIGIVGASGAGKTTLVEDLKARIKSERTIEIETIQGVSRDVIKLGYPLGTDAHPESYVVLMRSHLSKLLEVKSKNKIFISERTLIDQYCYSRVNKNLPRPMVSDELINLMEHVWRLEREYYWKYIYLPINSQTKGRQKDGTPEYQSQINNEFKQILIEFGCDFITIDGVNQVRTDEAYRLIIKLSGLAGLA